MFRYLLWILIIYFAWRIVRILFSLTNRGSSRKEPEKPFSALEDAEFEDITNKKESGEQNQKTD